MRMVVSGAKSRKGEIRKPGSPRLTKPKPYPMSQCPSDQSLGHRTVRAALMAMAQRMAEARMMRSVFGWKVNTVKNLGCLSEAAAGWKYILAVPAWPVERYRCGVVVKWAENGGRFRSVWHMIVTNPRARAAGE